MKRFTICLAAAVLLLQSAVLPAGAEDKAAVEGAKKEREVVVWTMTWTDGEKVVKPFEEKYPFLNVKVWDGRSEEIVNKLITEAKAGRHSPDVLILSTRSFPPLKDAGLLQEYPWPAELKRWIHQPKHKHWINLVGNLVGPTYNKNLVSSAQVPKSWEDLKNPHWKGKSVITSSGADAPLLFAYLWGRDGGKLNWDKTFAFWQSVIENTQPKVNRGFTAPTELQAGGEFPMFHLNSLQMAFIFMDKGAPLGIPPIGETVGRIFGMAVPDKTPHPNAARLFVEYLMSEEGLLAYSAANRVPVLDPVVAKKAKANVNLEQLGIQWDLIPDEALTAENVRKASEWWSSALGVRRRSR